MTNAEIDKDEGLFVSPGQPDIVTLYLNEACRHPLLSLEEERRLGLLMQQGKIAKTTLTENPSLSDEERERLKEMINQGEKARDSLIVHNLRLVVSVAKKYIGSGVPSSDLIQEGNVGLLRAVEKYDPTLGKKFSTYAYCWIMQTVIRAIAEQRKAIRMPIHADEDARRINRAINTLSETHDRKPNIEEISELTGLRKKRIELLLESSLFPFSLDQEVGENKEDSLADFLPDRASIDPEEGISVSKEELEEVLSTLSVREEKILKLRYGLDTNRPLTLQEIGEKFGLTRERIRQIEHKALKKLRHPSKARQLERLLR